MTDLDHAAVLDALGAGYGQVTDLVTGLGEAELMRPSGCAGWAVTDVLYHQLLDAQRALVAFATPVPAPPDRDDVTYWAAFAPRPGEAGAAGPGRGGGARPVRPRGRLRLPAGDPRPAVVRDGGGGLPGGPRLPRHRGRHPGACAAAGGLHRHPRRGDRGALPRPHRERCRPRRRPIPPPLALVRRVLDGLARTPLPASWDDAAAAVKGTGRVPLTDADRACWARWPARVPLFT